MLITQCSSKIHKSTLYKKAINDPIHRWHWKEVIKNELQNLENHKMQKYNKLPPRQKVIRSKWVFKLKYQPDSLIAKFKTRLIV